MVLPLPVIGIKALGWVQSFVFIYLSAKETQGLKAAQVVNCSVGRPSVLLAYRLFNLAITLVVGIGQYLDQGSRVFFFFTVWNWWLLAAFFLCGSIASARAVWYARNHRQTRSNAQKPADLLDRAVVAMYHVVTPMAFVVDLITWTVLVPMLMSSPDPAKVAFWKSRMFCFTSYMQHGVNAAMVLGEMLLSEMPGLFWHGGYLALWTSMYAVWSTIFYIWTGSFIYPFLDVHKPYAWLGYAALYAVHWTASLVFLGLVWLKNMVVRRFGVRAPIKTH